MTDGTALVRETVKLTVGECHMPDLRSIAASLVVTDLPTLLWSPAADREQAAPLLDLWRRACSSTRSKRDSRATAFAAALELADGRYVVDLSWLRTTPWRERLAAAFDRRRDALRRSAPSRSATHPGRSPPAPCSPAGSPPGWTGASRDLAPPVEGLAGTPAAASARSTRARARSRARGPRARRA